MKLPAASSRVSGNVFLVYIIPDMIRHPVVFYRFRLPVYTGTGFIQPE
jgi:hypothetical protein